MNENERRHYFHAGRYAGTMDTVWETVTGLTAGIENLPGFNDLEADDPVIRIWVKLQQILKIGNMVPGPVAEILKENDGRI